MKAPHVNCGAFEFGCWVMERDAARPKATGPTEPGVPIPFLTWRPGQIASADQVQVHMEDGLA